MSEGSLGGAELVAELVAHQFEASLKRLESDTTASFKRMGAASADILSAKVSSGVATSARTIKTAIDPAKASIDTLKNSVASLRNETEAYDRPASEQITLFKQIKAEALGAAQSVERGTKAHRDLTGVAATASRSVKTLSGETTRLGLSGNVAVGVTGRLTDSVKGLGTGVVNLGAALPGVIGVAGLGGLATVAGDLATKANAANVSVDILALTTDRLGVSSTVVQDSISNTATTLGVAEGQVVDYATQLLRIGVAADQIDDTLIAGASSALAFGKNAAQGMDSVTNALVTGNSANLQTIGISENVGAAMNRAAEGAANLGEQAAKQASAQEGVNIVLKATADEVASLDKLTGGLAGSQSRAATAAYETRMALGEMLIPLETMKNDALVGVLGLFKEMPSATQASVVGIGGVTAATAALATGASVLRAAMLPLLAPPAGLFIIGITTAAALGTALYGAHKRAEEFSTGVGQVARATSELNTSIDTFATSSTAAQDAIQGLSDATGEDGLVKALKAYGETLDTQSQAGLDGFISGTLSAILAQGDFDRALEESTAKVIEYEKNRLTLAQNNTRALAAARTEELEKLEENIKGFEEQLAGLGEGSLARNLGAALPGISGAQDKVVQELIANIAEAKSNYDELYETRELGIRQSQNYSNALAEIMQLEGGLADGTSTARETLEGLMIQLGLTAEQQQRLLGTTEPLPGALGDTGTAANSAASGLSNQATEAERALEATKDYVYMLSQGVQQGVRPFEGAMHLLTTALERQEGIQRTLAQQGKFGANYELAADKADLLRAAIEELTGIKIPDPGIEAAYGPFRDILPDVTATAGELRDLPTPEVEAFAGALVGIPLPEVTAQTVDYVGTLGGLPAAYEKAIAASKLLNDGQSEAAIKAALAREELEKLLAQGLSPTDAAVQAIVVEYNRWKIESDLVASAQSRVGAAVGDAKSLISQTKDIIGQTDFSQLTEGGPEAVEDFLGELNKLITLLSKLEKTNPKLFAQMGGAGALKDLKALVGEVENLGDELEDTEKAAKRLETVRDLTLEVLDAVGQLVGGLEGAGESFGIFAKTATDALSSLLSGDIVGFFGSIINGIIDLFSHGAKETEQYAAAVEKYGEDIASKFVGRDWMGNQYFDEGSLAEYEDYLEAVKEHGKELADQYARVGENGEFAFDSDGLQDYVDTQELITEAIEEQNERRREALDLVREIADAESGSTASLNDSQLQYAVDSGQINEQFAQIKQAKLDIIDAYGEYNDTLGDLAQQESDLNAALASGAITQAEYNASMADLAIQRNNAYSQLGYDVGSYLESAKTAAAEIGLSDKQLYEALLTGNDAVLGALSPQEREALSAGLNAYVATFGEFPPGMAEVAESLGYTIDGLTGQILDSSGNVVGATQQAATDQKAAISGLTSQLLAQLGPAAQPIIDQINALYDQQAAAHTQGGTDTANAAQQGLGATSIQALTSQLLAQFGPAAQGIVDQINGLYTQQQNAHITGAGIVGSAITGATSHTALAQAQATAKELGQISLSTGLLTGGIAGLFNSQASTTLSGADVLTSAIAGAADAQNKTQGSAVASVAGFLATVQGGLNKDIARHATDEARVTAQGGENVARTAADAWNAKQRTIGDAAKNHVSFLGKVAGAVWQAAANVANAEADGLAGRQAPKGGSDSFFQDAFRYIAPKINPVETLPPAATKPYKPKDPGAVNASKPSPKGSIGYVDDQLDKLRERYRNERDPKKRAQLARQIKALEKERGKMDVLTGGDGKGSGSSGGKGSSGSGKEIGPPGSPSYIQEQIRKLDDQIGKSANQGKIRQLQAKKEKLQAQLDKLLGNTDSAKPKPAKGSVDDIEDQLSKAREAYDASNNDQEKKAIAERIAMLEDELKAKRRLLEEATKDVQDAVKGQVISIESPLADLGTLAYLAEQISTTASRIPSTVASASSAGASSITRLPESYTTSILPSYQEQAAVWDKAGGHIDRFGGYIDDFGRYIRLFGSYLTRPKGGSSIANAARGNDSDWDLR